MKASVVVVVVVDNRSNFASESLVQRIGLEVVVIHLTLETLPLQLLLREEDHVRPGLLDFDSTRATHEGSETHPCQDGPEESTSTTLHSGHGRDDCGGDTTRDRLLGPMVSPHGCDQESFGSMKDGADSLCVGAGRRRRTKQ